MVSIKKPLNLKQTCNRKLYVRLSLHDQSIDQTLKDLAKDSNKSNLGYMSYKDDTGKFFSIHF